MTVTLDEARAKLDSGALLAARDVAVLFSVNSKTVSRWARAGLLDVVRTPGGHRRYKPESVAELLANWTRS